MARKDQTLLCTYGNNHNRTVQAEEHARMSAEKDSLFCYSQTPASILRQEGKDRGPRHKVKLCGAQGVAELHHASTNDKRLAVRVRSPLRRAPKLKRSSKGQGGQSLCLEVKDTKTEQQHERKPRTRGIRRSLRCLVKRQRQWTKTSFFLLLKNVGPRPDVVVLCSCSIGALLEWRRESRY